MANIEKILSDLNIPKQIIDKSEALLKTLFGPSMDEIGGMISDNVRLRRFKNQLKIFTKAQDILKEKKIDPKKVSLKVLAPLIEFSSYEEEESLQSKWSSLTAHILSDKTDIIFHQNCISILNKLSTEDAILLDFFHQQLIDRRIKRFENKDRYYISKRSEFIRPGSPEAYPLDNFSFRIRSIYVS